MFRRQKLALDKLATYQVKCRAS